MTGEGDGSTPPEQTSSNKYAEVVGGETPSPFAAVSLLVALGCALIALPTWPDVSDWWYAATIFAIGAVILAAFTYLGLPGQDDAPNPPGADDSTDPAH